MQVATRIRRACERLDERLRAEHATGASLVRLLQTWLRELPGDVSRLADEALATAAGVQLVLRAKKSAGGARRRTCADPTHSP